MTSVEGKMKWLKTELRCFELSSFIALTVVRLHYGCMSQQMTPCGKCTKHENLLHTLWLFSVIYFTFRFVTNLVTQNETSKVYTSSVITVYINT